MGSKFCLFRGWSGLVLGLLAVPGPAGQTDDPPAAWVGDYPIPVSGVEWQFADQFGNAGDIDPQIAARLRAEILRQRIDQQLILMQLAETGFRVTADQVDLQVARIAERAAEYDQTLDEFLSGKKLTRPVLRFNLKWQASWQKYLDSTLTDEVLERYFRRHQRQFDGTRVRVAHLLLPLTVTVTPEETEQARQLAEAIATRIRNGELEWTQATGQYSAAPTAGDGGDLGWIEYARPMSREFSEAAFTLDPEEISPPVQTRAGIHLIRCLEVRPGSTNWYDVRRPLRAAAVRELFRLLADRKRSDVEIRFTGVTPWIDPESGELQLAVPERR